MVRIRMGYTTEFDPGSGLTQLEMKNKGSVQKKQTWSLKPSY